MYSYIEGKICYPPTSFGFGTTTGPPFYDGYSEKLSLTVCDDSSDCLELTRATKLMD